MGKEWKGVIEIDSTGTPTGTEEACLLHSFPMFLLILSSHGRYMFHKEITGFRFPVLASV